MNRQTLGSVKRIIAKVIGCHEDNAQVRDYVNQAQERLINMGQWVGTKQRYRFCTNAACITLPRQLLSIEAYAICDQPGMIHNDWFEYLDSGPGQIEHDDSWGTKLLPRGTAPAFDDIIGSNSVLRVVSSAAEDVDSRILLQGWDVNNSPIRTLDGTDWVDGEYVAIGTVGANTVTRWMRGGFTAAQKPITNGIVRIYEVDMTTSTQRALAVYEPDEELPVYRRYLLPGIANMAICANDTVDNDCETKVVTVIAKLKHMPVRIDTDYLIIGNLNALKLMVQAIIKEEDNLWDDARKYESSAIGLLQQELKAYQGSGQIINIRRPPRTIWGGGVENAI